MNNPNEWSWYCNELSELKFMIANLKRAYINEGTLSKHNYMMKVAYDFNPLMYKFIGKWGKDMVPSDLRVAINNIEIDLFDTARSGWTLFDIGNISLGRTDRSGLFSA